MMAEILVSVGCVLAYEMARYLVFRVCRAFVRVLRALGRGARAVGRGVLVPFRVLGAWWTKKAAHVARRRDIRDQGVWRTQLEIIALQANQLANLQAKIDAQDPGP